MEESIRLDHESYSELLDEERALHKELGSLRKRLDEDGSDEFLKEVISRRSISRRPNFTSTKGKGHEVQERDERNSGKNHEGRDDQR